MSLTFTLFEQKNARQSRTSTRSDAAFVTIGKTGVIAVNSFIADALNIAHSDDRTKIAAQFAFSFAREDKVAATAKNAQYLVLFLVDKTDDDNLKNNAKSARWVSARSLQTSSRAVAAEMGMFGKLHVLEATIATHNIANKQRKCVVVDVRNIKRDFDAVKQFYSDIADTRAKKLAEKNASDANEK